MKRDEQGFTLVELLVTLAISGIVMAGVYSAYFTQQRSYVTQEQVAAVQQNIRAAMFYLEREIRMAGYDPGGSSGAGIVAAGPSSIQFTKDEDGDGLLTGMNEDITYSLYDAYGDGDDDLGRAAPSQNRAIAENIDAFNIIYLDENGSQLDDGGGSVTTNINNIRSVQVTIVARTENPIQGYTDTTTYQNQQGDTLFTSSGDDTRYRRRVLSAEIRCRNLGLE